MYYNSTQTIITLVIVLAVIAALFLILRALVLWYYKIDVRVRLMEDNNNLLRSLIREVGDLDLKADTKKGSPRQSTKPKVTKESTQNKKVLPAPAIRAQEVDVDVPPYLEQEAENLVKRAVSGDRVIYDVNANQVEKLSPQAFEKMLEMDKKYVLLVEV